MLTGVLKKQKIAKLYTKRNLELFKSYYIVHFVSNNIDLLDREAYEKNKQIHKDYSLDTMNSSVSDDVLPMPNNAENLDSMSDEEKETALLFNDYINKYMGEPMEVVYIAKYCTPEAKEDLKELIDDIRSIYEALIEKGLNVFFARISLEDKIGSEYEPLIFAALNSARVMLVLGSSSDNFNAVWVRNEWSRFIGLMKQDKKKELIPCYCDMNAYDMPAEFSNLQAQDLGKIGAIQDIIRGIAKIVQKTNEKKRKIFYNRN